MPGDIYSMARVLYSLVMPPARTGKCSYTTQLSRRDVDFVEAERARRGERHVSAVVEAALRGLLTAPGFGTDPLPVPSTINESLVAVTYRLSPGTVDLVRQASKDHGYQGRQIVRAAIHALQRRAAGDQGPTQTGR